MIEDNFGCQINSYIAWTTHILDIIPTASEVLILCEKRNNENKIVYYINIKYTTFSLII